MGLLDRIRNRRPVTSTTLSQFSPSLMAKITPEIMAQFKPPEWFREGDKISTKLQHKREKAKAKRLKIAHPKLVRKEELRKVIDKKAIEIREVSPDQITTTGLKLLTEMKRLTEKSNNVNRELDKLGFGSHIYSPIPDSIAGMLHYIELIRAGKIFRVAKKK